MSSKGNSMTIAELITEMQERPVKTLTVFVNEKARCTATERLQGRPARGVAYEYEGGFLVFRANVPSQDLEMNGELEEFYAHIAYPMPVTGLRTLKHASTLTDMGGCYCGTCMNGRIEDMVRAIWC